MANLPKIDKILPEQSEPYILAICTILIAMIFVLDISLRIGFVVSVLYVVPVLVCIWSQKEKDHLHRGSGGVCAYAHRRPDKTAG